VQHRPLGLCIGPVEHLFHRGERSSATPILGLGLLLLLLLRLLGLKLQLRNDTHQGGHVARHGRSVQVLLQMEQGLLLLLLLLLLRSTGAFFAFGGR